MKTLTMPTAPKATPVQAQPARVSVDAQQLLNNQSEIEIRHGNEVYRLRLTRNDKLILTK